MDGRLKKIDWKQLARRAQAAFEKFRLPLVILALGVGLLLWPSGEKETPAEAQTAAAAAAYSDNVQQALRDLLSQMDGVGRVELMLTTSGSETAVYQTDVRQSGDTREETTVFESAQSTQKTPVVVKTQAAPYLGAVVVCDGAERAAVRLRVIQAVSALTGLGSDKISVIKMKRQ